MAVYKAGLSLRHANVERWKPGAFGTAGRKLFKMRTRNVSKIHVDKRRHPSSPVLGAYDFRSGLIRAIRLPSGSLSVTLNESCLSSVSFRETCAQIRILHFGLKVVPSWVPWGQGIEFF